VEPPTPDAPPPLAASKRTVGSVLRDPNVRHLTLTQLALSTGTFLQAAVLGKQIFDITGSEFALGLLGLVEFAPAALLVLLTGAVADRFDRRKVACIGLVAEGCGTAALLLYTRTNPTAVWPFFVIACAFGAARAFVTPATRAMPPMVAPPGTLPRVIALNSATFTTAIIIGPASSGILYSIDPALAYAVALILLVIGLVGMATLHFRHDVVRIVATDRPTLHSALGGLRFIRQTPVLLAAIALDLFAVLFGGAVALLPAIAEDRLHVGDVAYGWLRASIGVGSALTALFLAVRPVERRVGRTLLVVVGLFGALTIVLGLTHSYVVAFVALAALSGLDMVSMFIRSTLVPLLTPDETRGRVLAVEAVFIGASNELGAFESGVAAAALGLPIAVAGGGVVTIAVVVMWWFGFPTLRDIDRFDDIDPTQFAGITPPAEPPRTRSVQRRT
jgi:MFS family permease